MVCGSFLNCTFGCEEKTVDVIGGSPATMKTTGLSFTTVSGVLCPSEVALDAEYTVNTPTSLFVI
jgi:hypothetical protein